MKDFLSVTINKAEILKICREQVEQLIQEFDNEFVFWDTNQLKKRTCMSWNTIQEYFFFDPRFPKRKVGGKWYFPAHETREFLREWLLEQTG
ncbi:group-specific protein [Paenibacillus sonchi]|uniref:Group-specific protein n=1 Tax=Paenibacillus sonchi TaxID=373687 RepID=A0A974P8U3_9BACL|nr:group-specific protein [Paenibacillus sonchi]QQZ58852.1 group-specific protein [Paenibacillus sonchi]